MMRILSALFAAAPLVAAFIRARRGGGDLRMLWMAVAGLAATIAVAVVAQRQPAGRTAVVAGAGFALATLAAAITGAMSGASSATAVLLVATAFGISLAIAAVLSVRSR